jgi:hypothetical protein
MAYILCSAWQKINKQRLLLTRDIFNSTEPEYLITVAHLGYEAIPHVEYVILVSYLVS